MITIDEAKVTKRIDVNFNKRVISLEMEDGYYYLKRTTPVWAFREFLTYYLFTDFQIKVPKPELIKVGISENVNIEMMTKDFKREGYEYFNGSYFSSQVLGNRFAKLSYLKKMIHKKCENQEEVFNQIMLMTLLDHFTSYPDRHADNFFYEKQNRHYDLIAIDHNFAFFTHPRNLGKNYYSYNTAVQLKEVWEELKIELKKNSYLESQVERLAHYDMKDLMEHMLEDTLFQISPDEILYYQDVVRPKQEDIKQLLK